MTKKIISSGAISAAALLLSAGSVFAHVVVRPAEVGVASFQTFTVGVPNEKEQPAVGVRLVIPEGLEHVSPNVKPGWKVETKAEASGESDGEHSEEVVTEISWTGGSIPSGMRDDFLFSAAVPAEETTLTWKAYQTYQDGTVVSWEITNHDDQPKNDDGTEDYSSKGPASITKVVNDLTPETETQTTLEKYAPYVAYGALLLGAIGVALGLRKPKA